MRPLVAPRPNRQAVGRPCCRRHKKPRHRFPTTHCTSFLFCTRMMKPLVAPRPNRKRSGYPARATLLGPIRIQKSATPIAGKRDKVDMFLIIVNPPFNHRSVTFSASPNVNYATIPRMPGVALTIHGRVPKAQEAAPSIPDDTLHVILVLHTDDETSCRSATQPTSGRATLLSLRDPTDERSGYPATVEQRLPQFSDGPTIHGRMPKAQEAAPSIFDDTSHVFIVLHTDDESSCRSATQPQKVAGLPC